MPGIMLEVDASDLQKEIDRLRRVMTPTAFENAMAGIFRRTGSHVRKILRQDLPKEYNIKSGEVGSAVKGASFSGGGASTGCCIPVVAARRHIGGGGRGFTARGYRSGWRALHSGHYDVTAHIYRGSWGTLPANMASYGGQPPFRNIPSKLGGLTFTRAGKSRLPIMPVYGIAIPQMPLNRSEPDVQNDIKVYLEERIRARFMAILAGGG